MQYLSAAIVIIALLCWHAFLQWVKLAREREQRGREAFENEVRKGYAEFDRLWTRDARNFDDAIKKLNERSTHWDSAWSSNAELRKSLRETDAEILPIKEAIGRLTHEVHVLQTAPSGAERIDALHARVEVQEQALKNAINELRGLIGPLRQEILNAKTRERRV